MKVSEITTEDIGAYVNVDAADPLLPAMLSAAVSFVKGYTALTDTEIDEHEDITLAVLTLVSDMYDVRSIQVDKDTINWTAQSILSMYAKNYLPDPDDEGGDANG